MQVTNRSNSRLQFADGQAVDAGQTVNIDKFDDKHHVTKAVSYTHLTLPTIYSV